MRFRGGDFGKTLWPEHYDQTPRDIKHGIVAEIADASAHNERWVFVKACLVMSVLITTGIEAILVGIALTVSRLG